MFVDLSGDWGQTLDIAPLHEEASSQKRSGMARVVEGSQHFACYPRVYLRTECTIPAFAFPAKAGPHLPTPERCEAELTSWPPWLQAWYSLAVFTACQSRRCSRLAWSSRSCRVCSWSTIWTWSKRMYHAVVTGQSPTDGGQLTQDCWTTARRTDSCQVQADHWSTSLASPARSLPTDVQYAVSECTSGVKQTTIKNCLDYKLQSANLNQTAL